MGIGGKEVDAFPTAAPVKGGGERSQKIASTTLTSGHNWKASSFPPTGVAVLRGWVGTGKCIKHIFNLPTHGLGSRPSHVTPLRPYGYDPRAQIRTISPSAVSHTCPSGFRTTSPNRAKRNRIP